MRVVGEAIVYRNPFPAQRAIVASASTLTRVPAGAAGPETLLCAYRRGTAKVSRDGRIHVAESTDGGSTWTEAPSPFRDHGQQDVAQAGPQMGGDDRGTVVLTAARMWTADPETPEFVPEAAGIVDADSLVVRRDPGGAWKSVTEVDGRRHDDEWAIPCGPPISLGSGRWLWPMERHGKAQTEGWLRRYHAFFGISEDDGRSWDRFVPALNGDGRLAYYDQRLVALGNGRVLTVAWVHDVDVDVTLTARAGWSEDGGETWSEPVDTGIVGGPVNPIRLADGRILAVYNRRSPPSGIRCALSEDDGRSWKLDEEWVIYDEATRSVVGSPATVRPPGDDDAALWDSMWGWTFGTPTPVQLADGTVVITFFAMDGGGVSAIRAVRIEV